MIPIRYARILLLSAILGAEPASVQPEPAAESEVRARVLAIFEEGGSPEERQQKLEGIGSPLAEVLLELAATEQYQYPSQEALVRLGAAVVPRLLEGLNSSNEGEKFASLQVLARIDDPRKYEPLWRSMQSEDVDFAFEALYFSSNLDWPEGFWTPRRLQPLIERIRGDDPYASVQAGSLVLRVGDVWAAGELGAALSGPGGFSCDRFGVPEIRRDLPRFPHAEVLRLFDLTARVHCWDHPDASAAESRLDRLPFEPNPDSDDLQGILGQIGPRPPQLSNASIELLFGRIAENRGHELLLALEDRIDERLVESQAPGAELRTLASLSAARARSRAVEASSRFLSEGQTEVLSRLAEPASVAVLERRLRQERQPEQWFATAQSLARAAQGMPVDEVRAYLEGQQVPQHRIEAVVQTMAEPAPPVQEASPLFPTGVPPYMMLSILRDRSFDDRLDSSRLHRDRLATSSALLAALRQSPEAGARALSSRTARSGALDAELVWAFTRDRSEAGTARLREWLERDDPRVSMIARELGRREDRGSIPALLTLLGSESDLACAAAAWALGRMRVSSALPALRRELGRRGRFAERDLVEAIVRIEGDQAAAGLIEGNVGSVSREYLLFPLARSGPSGARSVVQIFADAVPEGLDAVAAGQALLASRRLDAVQGFVQVLLDRAESFDRRGYTITQSLLPYLAEQYDHPELEQPLVELVLRENFEAWVAQGLVRQPGEFADRVIRAAILRGVSPSRFTEYLSRRPMRSLGPQLEAAYRDGGRKSWHLRALIASGSAEGVKVVRELLEQDDPVLSDEAVRDVIRAVYQAPGQEGWELLPRLYGRLSERERFLALSDVPRRPAGPALVRYLVSLLDREPVETDRKTAGGYTLDFAGAAARALERAKAAEAVDEVLARWDRENIRSDSVLLVGRHLGADRIEALFELVRKRDYSAWRRVEIALAGVARGAPEVLVPYAGERDVEIRRKVAAVCRDLSGPITSRILLQLASDADPLVRAEAVAAMDRGPAEAFSGAVIRALEDPDPLVQTEAARVAGASGVRGAVAALVALLDQPDHPAAAAAAHSLSTLGGARAEEALRRAASRLPPDLTAILGLGRMRAGSAVPLLLRMVEGDLLEARQLALRALGQIATREAVSGLLDAHLASPAYVAAYARKAARQEEPEEAPPPAASDAQLMQPPVSWPPAGPGRYGTSEPLSLPTPVSLHFSYRREGTESWLLWKEYREDPDGEQQPFVVRSHSRDGELTWSPPETLLEPGGAVSHAQWVRTGDGDEVLLFARGRKIFAARLTETGSPTEYPIPVGTPQSQTVRFNLLERADGSYALFAAVGTPVPNDTSKEDSRLVVLTSDDLADWSPPRAIAPITEGLGYFTVEDVLAAEAPDGWLLVGAGKKLYRSRSPSGPWETVWDGEGIVAGWGCGLAAIAVGEDHTVHLGFRSRQFGFDDLFVTSSSDLGQWSPPVFTGLHGTVGSATIRAVGSVFLHPLSRDEMQVVHFVPGSAGGVVRTVLNLAALAEDTDGDGLTDAIEERILTDPKAVDSDGDGISDGQDRNPIAPGRPASDAEKIRQAALDRLNRWDGEQSDSARAAPLLMVVSDGTARQEFSHYSGLILNLSHEERNEYRKRFGRFGVATQEVVITEFEEGASRAAVHSFTGHEAFSMTVHRVGPDWVVTRVEATFRVY